MLGLNKLDSSSNMSQNPQTESEMKFGENQVSGRHANAALALQSNLNPPFHSMNGKNSDLVVKTLPYIKTVEWEMLDKRKFFPLSMLSSFTVRCFLYPLTLIRTRLQVQKGKEVYTGTFDAGRKIVQSEGVRGLYRGFLVSTVQIVSGLCYGKIPLYLQTRYDIKIGTIGNSFMLFSYFIVTTYESVRHTLERNNIRNNKVKSFVGGCCASIVGQTIIVPFDVITQHIMLIGLAEKSARKTSTETHSSSLLEHKNSSGTEKRGSANLKNNSHINMNKASKL